MTHIEQALAISREVGDRRGEGNALLNLLVIYMEQYRYGDVVELLPDALGVCRDVGDQQGEAMAMDIEAHIHLLTGAFAEAERVLLETWQLCERIGDSWGLMETCLSRAQLYWHLGDFAQTAACAEDGLARARALSDQANEAKGLNILGHGRFAQDNYADALTAYEAATALWQALDQPHLTLESEMGRLLCWHRWQRPLPQDVLDRCVSQLLEQPLYGLSEPGWVLYAGYRLLIERRDARAERVRERGVSFLGETAVQFPQPHQQENYRHKIRHHQALLTA
jgi:tetratricopeptide (TPR) repeat protein